MQTHGRFRWTAVYRLQATMNDVRKPTCTYVLQDVWINLPAELLQKLCASVSRRVDAFFDGHTIDLVWIHLKLIHSILWIDENK